MMGYDIIYIQLDIILQLTGGHWQNIILFPFVDFDFILLLACSVDRFCYSDKNTEITLKTCKYANAACLNLTVPVTAIWDKIRLC